MVTGRWSMKLYGSMLLNEASFSVIYDFSPGAVAYS